MTMPVTMPFQEADGKPKKWESAETTETTESSASPDATDGLAQASGPLLEDMKKKSLSPPSLSIFNAPLQRPTGTAPVPGRNMLNARELCTELNTYVVEEAGEFATKAIEGLVKRLRRDPVQLEHLFTALSTGMKETPCVTFPKTRDGRIQIARQKHFPPETFYRLFRNTEVRTGDIVALAECYHNSIEKGSLVCVNPYHYRECRSDELTVPLKRRRRRTAPPPSRLDTVFAVPPLATSAPYAQGPWTPVTRLGQQPFSAVSTTMYNPNNVFYAAHPGSSHGMAPFIYENQFAYLQDPTRMMRAPITPNLHQPTFYPQDCFQMDPSGRDSRVRSYASTQFAGAEEPPQPCRIRLASENDDATRNEPLDVTSC